MSSKNVPRAPSRSSSMSMKPPPPRVPLMTPSASPPVQRPFGRQYDGPSPTKRRRMMSETPVLANSGSSMGGRSRSLGPASSTFPLPSPALSVDHMGDPSDTLHAARRESSFKVLQVWSHLAEKYAKPLDEDDIVDLENETIIKDRGIIRSSSSAWDIGCFADDHELERQQLASEDEPDEIDAFAETASRSETDGEEDDFELARPELRLPPVRELDPADAADLAEFMEAERRRKDLFGDIDEEFDRMSFNSRSEAEYDDDESGQGFEAQGDEDSQTEHEGPRDEEECASDKESTEDYYEVYEDYEVRLRDEEDSAHYRVKDDYRNSSTPSGSPEIDFIDLSTADSGSDDDPQTDVAVSEKDIDPPDESSEVTQVDHDSEDELGGWDQDEGTSVYELADPEVVEIVEDDDDEVPDTTSLFPESTSTINTSAKRISSKPSAESQKLKPKSKASKVSSESGSGALSLVEPVQLNTPPRSSSFGPESRRKKDNPNRLDRRSKPTPARMKSVQEMKTVSHNNPGSKKADPKRNRNFNKAQVDQQQTTPDLPNIVTKPDSKLFPEVYVDVPTLESRKPAAVATTSRQAKKRDEPTEYASSNLDLSRTPSSKLSTWKGKEKAHGESREVSREGSRDRAATPHVERRTFTSTAKSQDPERRTQNNTEVDRIAGKRRRESSPPQYLEVEEYKEYTQDYVYDDYASQPSTTTSISPSPSPRPTPGHDRTSSSSISSYSHDHDFRYVEQDPGPSSRQNRFEHNRSIHSRVEDHYESESPAPNQRARSHSRSRSQRPSNPSDDTSTTRTNSQRTERRLPREHQPTPAPVVPLQTPEAQFHLAQIAQNLQNLTALLGGSLMSDQAPLSQLGDLARVPFTPNASRHHYHHHIETPQSGATAPPTSSPVGSDYSDLLSSSPLKHSVQERGRSRSVMEYETPRRPKSAMRSYSRSSRNGRSRSRRRVSFSSPEAIHIDDDAFVSQPWKSDDSDVATNSSRNHSRRTSSHELRRESSHLASNGSNRGSTRAQTPGPPEGPRSPQRPLQRSRTMEELPRHDHQFSRPRTPSSHYHSVDMERQRHQ